MEWPAVLPEWPAVLSEWPQWLLWWPQWSQATRMRRSGGLLCAARPCQIVAAAKMLYAHESPTGVYFFLAELLDFVAKARHVSFSKLNSKARRQFLRHTFPTVVYDCACTLHRFMRHKTRRQRTKMSKAMTALHRTIDKFHFKSGHASAPALLRRRLLSSNALRSQRAA